MALRVDTCYKKRGRKSLEKNIQKHESKQEQKKPKAIIKKKQAQRKSSQGSLV